MSQFTFNSVPLIRHKRSQFDLSHIVKTSGNVGTLYPFDIQEVYPGDSMKVQTNIVTRLTSTFLRPVVDNLFLDVYHFYVPSRLLYDHWEEIFGENKNSAWAQTVEYSVPMIDFGNADGLGRHFYSKSVADYFGLPVSGDGSQLSQNVPVSILPFRAFAKIYDDWFRDQNNIDPMHIQTGAYTHSVEFQNNLPWSPANYTGLPPHVGKLHDYFTSSLPAPQKGMTSSIPIQVGSQVQWVPVQPHYTGTFPVNEGIRLAFIHQNAFDDNTATQTFFEGFTNPGGALNPSNVAQSRGVSTTNNQVDNPIVGTNLGARLSDLNLGGISVSDLRFAVQFQKMLERDARSGTRYVEYLRAAFGVSAGDSRLQRSEFLGGKRMPISITQVTQTTGSDSDSSPLGQVGAFSLSGGSTRFNKGFVEHGFVISVYCIRQFHTYQQGIERFWTRSKRTDFFDPVFSHLSEQPVYTSEIYAFGETAAQDRRVFGYQEAWCDLRSRQNRITGQMRTGVTDSLDVWHFGDYYANAPTLSPGFINETPDNVDRTISVSSEKQDQFLLDFYVRNRAYRPLPTYSVPGLVDHG